MISFDLERRAVAVVDLEGRLRDGVDRGLLAGRGKRLRGDGEHLSMNLSHWGIRTCGSLDT